MKILKAVVMVFDISITGTIMYLAKVKSPKSIWLISEREDQAQDNGVAFFEYLNQKHPEIESYYILEKDNKNITKVQKIGKVLIRGSFKHKLYFLRSEVVASTEKNIIEPWGSNIFYKYIGRYFPEKLRVFLQHGITDKDVSHVYGKAVSPFNLFVTTAKREKAFIINKFGYPAEEVINVGFPRYDKLVINQDEKQKQILFMPTWRRYLNDLARVDKKYKEAAKKAFINSKYYEAIQGFINDERLNSVLQKEGYTMMLVMHHGMNIFKDTFSAGNRVRICGSEEVEIAQLLKEAEIFITDYSSIHFDSAYLGNINLYYQFDIDDFRKGHADASYFDYEEDGFGEVSYTQDELINYLIKAISQKGIRKEKFSQRVNTFFTYTDNENCERLYQEIIERINKKE
ncbi:CDP-glycerol glycerophosphotransferase family protein [Cellulosilyticum ruminicola]|uniref:CDP-glycerol glycerophosphotransferase family protein n=1 Tax=Cellulosilyticum ruminicola TaxID=425254 RepID=UPI0006D1D164|nr:CDP-glycerol glycerophosphotransferase family protein [Cellulosilyticum ruminicola]